jgi:hypothetical protein
MGRDRYKRHAIEASAMRRGVYKKFGGQVYDTFTDREKRQVEVGNGEAGIFPP